MKKKLLIAILILIILLVPIKSTYLDGGTVTYSSLIYKIIKWKKLDFFYEDGYKRGTEIHLFPTNFKSLDYYNSKYVHPTGLAIMEGEGYYATHGSYDYKGAHVRVMLVDDFNAYRYLDVTSSQILGILQSGNISNIEIYKDSFENKLNEVIEFNNSMIKVPNLKGKYVLVIKINYEGKDFCDYYVGLNIK